MTDAPHQSLPKACRRWSDLKAAYRLLSNESVDPHAIQGAHRRQTLEACAGHKVVLCVQDTTEIDLTRKATMRGRGKLGNGGTQGVLQHTGLAIVPGEDDAPLDQPGGELLGVLHTRWNRRTEASEHETLRELQSRRTDADVWLETATAVAELGATSARLIHVGDRHCDLFRFFLHADRLGHGFVVRARYDRALEGAPHEAPGPMRLFTALEARPVACETTLTIHEQRTYQGQTRRAGRGVTLEVRYDTVMIEPPLNDPRTAGAPPLRVRAVYVREKQPPQGQEPVWWMLLTSEPVNDAADAMRIVRYYRHRWVIEEWHRVLKEGCQVEAAQFDDVEDVQRLAAIKGVIAVRMLQMRDLADRAGEDPAALQHAAPTMWIRIVAALAGRPPDQLTPRQFWLTIAKRGGYLARKHDPRPGWTVIWRGWYDITQMTQGATLLERVRSG